MLPVGVVLFVSALIGATCLPAQAVPVDAISGADTYVADETGHSQRLSVVAAAATADPARDSYSTTDLLAIARAAAAKAKAAAGGDVEPSSAGVQFIPAPAPVLWPTDISPEIGKGVSSGHHGQDLLVAGGTPVHAMADGVVVTSTTQGSLGNYVAVQSTLAGHTVTALYAHLESRAVEVGQTVTMGTTIGAVGSTGAATTNLVYMRIIQDGALVDTITYIRGNPAGGAAPH